MLIFQVENQHTIGKSLFQAKREPTFYSNITCYPGNYRSRQRWKKIFQTHLSHTLVITQSIFAAGYLCETINHIFKIHLLKSYTRLDLQREEFQQRESFTFSLGNDIKGHWTEIGDKLSSSTLMLLSLNLYIFALDLIMKQETIRITSFFLVHYRDFTWEWTYRNLWTYHMI